MINKIKYVLKTRSIVNVDEINDFSLVDHSDGNGAKIEQWNTKKLGAKPTASDLDALDNDPAFVAYFSATAWAVIRAERDNILAGCDWTQLGDSQLKPGVQASWLTYRQELRDITSQPNPENIIWPAKPY